jgi:diguanylate cyclase (GGDEF)-like protein
MPFGWSRGNFTRKMTAVVLLASGTALATLTVAFLLLDSVRSRYELQSRLSTLADVVGQNSTAALHFSDATAAVEVLEALRAEAPITSVCLYEVSGGLFARYQRDKGPQACPENLAQVETATDDYSRVVRPVLRHGEAAGTLYLRSDLRQLQERRRRLLFLAAGLLIAALAVGGFAGSLLQRRISQPISQLARAMRRVTDDHNFAERVEVTGNDEIARLGVGFNTMLAEIERREAGKKKAEAALQQQAFCDALTGLPNRRLLTDRLCHTLAGAKRSGRLVALLYLDLDGFKLVNDSLGHHVGDRLLVNVATRLRSRVRQADTLARLGGDEFTVVLGNLGHISEAATVADALLKVLAAPFLIGDHELTISASIGISIYPDGAADSTALLQQADSAMYAAKRGGKNRMMYYSPELGSAVRERLNLESQLRGAIDRGEIHIHYQPEFDLQSGSMVRFEALARWTHPTLGVIAPSRFIPIAEESGIIVSLGAYIMEQACADALQWQTMAPYPIQVAVNVSSVQFEREDFVQQVIEILNRTGLPPALLQIELTESVMLRSVDRAAEAMHALRGLGVSFAIDDFGTGYSCLSYLPKLPFKALKIDRSFLPGLDSRSADKGLVHSLIALAHNLGMRVIVEGVEHPEQVSMIRAMGGNEVQGYLLGPPSADPAARIALLVKKEQEESCAAAVIG